MLDLFAIFSKGGIVLWCFQGTEQALTCSVNALIKSVILQERGGSSFSHDALTLKYKLDNEFELVFVVAYQKILQLSYIDKFLSDIQLEFRNKYKDDLQQYNICRNFSGFTDVFQDMIRLAEEEAKQKAKAPKLMRSYDQSLKSQKTVGSMIENKSKDDTKTKKNNKKETKSKVKNGTTTGTTCTGPKTIEKVPSSDSVASNDELDEETRLANLAKLRKRMGNGTKQPVTKNKSPVPEATKKKGKQATKWELGGNSVDTKDLDFGQSDDGQGDQIDNQDMSQVGKMIGEIQDMDPESSDDEQPTPAPTNTKSKTKSSGGGGFSLFNNLKSLVGSKTLTQTDIEPVLDKMRDHLIGKNVAADIADKLCDSVATKLEGRVLGTFNTVAYTVKSALQESCMTLLRPHRRVDILRDAMAARDAKRPYVVTFCGVNGVGKSTNLAKICFWLIENGLRVLIAACDTFRAGAVEQLRTHQRKLNALHPATAHSGKKMVELYEKGYGKDAAGIAMEAINYARDLRFDIVLVDTAGRMQDNEPLMRALSKLISVNQPDLVLFVGEALVGNEAVDQLTKFNQALADHSQMAKPRLIDGIVLTKFDTIDDKVGAAISMTYTTGQPIVFVGTGQTYTDLKNLNAKAVVHALLKA